MAKKSKVSTVEQKFVNFMVDKSQKPDPEPEPFNVKEENRASVEEITDLINKKIGQKK